MRQLLHIFRKDVRGLWAELANFMGSLVLASFIAPMTSGYSDYSLAAWSGEGLVLISGCFLIARLIHAEAIPGTNQFWTTRPYRWTSLLGAKVLFILIFAHLPVFIAQAVMLRSAEFPILGNLPALLWMQVGMAAFVSVPAATLAALTSGLSGLLLSSVGVVAPTVLLSILRGSPGANRIFFPPAFWRFARQEFEWIPFVLLAVTLLIVGVPGLVAQYRARKTALSRLLLGTAYLVGLVVSFWGGPDLRWTIQTMAATKPLDTTSYQFSIGIPTRMVAHREQDVPEWPPVSYEGTSVAVNVPLSITGLPPGLYLGAERISLNLETPDGEPISQVVWDGWHDGPKAASSDGRREFSVELYFPDGKVYEKLRTKPTAARGFIDLFVMGNERSMAVPKAAFPYNVTNSFRCDLESLSRSRGNFKDLSCRVAFRSPLQTIDVNGQAFVQVRSFSPFPVDRLFNPILDTDHARQLPQADESVKFTLREPISYVRQKFEVRDVRLIEGPGTQLGWKGEQR